MIDSLHFIRPYWFFAFLPMLLLLFYFSKNNHQGNSWHQVFDTHLLKPLIQHNDKTKRWHLIALALFWSSIILALTGPSWEKLQQPVYEKNVSRVIVLDASPNMLGNDIKPSRFKRAEFKILDILKQHKEGSIGLVVFSQYAYTVSPLTNDSKTIINLVKTLSPNIMPSKGDNIAAGLEKAQQLLQQTKVDDGEIILVTASTPDAATFKTAKKIHANGTDISVLAIGTQQGSALPNAEGDLLQNTKGDIVISQLNTNTLKKLAQQGGGDFVTLSTNDRDVKTLLRDTKALAMKQTRAAEETRLWKDQGYYLLFFIVPLALLSFRRGWFERLLP